MKISSLLLPVSAVALFVAVIAFAQSSQTPAPATSTLSSPQPRVYPVPTNLKVLPKNLTGQQVHDIMEKWEGNLGAHCSTCHTPDPNNIGPNGKPRLNFADDSKPEKDTARMMYVMTEKINKDYISMIESSGAPVTCGTCHRGHLGPEPFTPLPEHAEPKISAPATPQPK